ncbi:MAG: PAS domain S-box protein, partial [Thermodesulfobacteriota bacterium]
LNPAFTRVFGWRAEELLGKKIDFVPEEALPETQAMIKRVLFGSTISGVETIRYTKDLRVLDVSISAAPFRDSSGNITGIVAIHRDITEKKQAEEALWASESKYYRVLEASPDPIVVYDMEGKVLYVNPSFTLVFGWTLEELMGKRTDFVPEEAWPETRERIEQVKRGVSFQGFETIRYNKNREVLNISMSAAVWRDRNDVPAGSVIILRDITEQKKNEAQLRQAQKMEAVGTLAGGIAHDFNNILQAVAGYVQLMLIKKKTDEPDHEYLTEIDQLTERASELVKQLLTISRKWESRPRPVNLNQELLQVCKLLNRTIPKMITIETHLAEDLNLIHADPIQLEQIILNLSSNARDAMPEGGKLIFQTKNVELDDLFYHTYPDIEPGDYLRLSVSDTGSGMTKETLEHVFDPFFTTKTAEKGTGLGLSTVYGIVKNHGGLITCYSTPGQGTIFHIYFPALKEVGELEEKVQRAVTMIEGGQETLLLVDDEMSILNIGEEILTEYGYNVIRATSGEEALEAYKGKKDSIDLVILDLGMPGMGGFNCLNELKALNPSVKVIIASGYSSSSLAKDILESGASGFIGKPYRITELLQRVRETLDAPA